MADSNNQTVTGPLPQGPSCLLLNGHLPREIRDKIYQFIFEGAEVLFDPPKKMLGITKPVRKGQGDAFVTTAHWQLLLTCRQAYDEGRGILCAEMRLCSTHKSTSYLAVMVSDFTRAHVRYLSPHFQTVFQRFEELALGLRQFPGVQVCELWSEDTNLCRREWDFHTGVDVSKLSKILPVPVVQKFTGWKERGEDLSIVPEVREDVPIVKEHCFHNWTTGLSFVTHNIDIDNDEGYQRVIDGNTVTKCDGGWFITAPITAPE